MNPNIKLTKENFHFDYPPELVATKPVFPRDRSKLLVYQGKKIIDAKFYQIDGYIPEGSLLILNNTKVFPSRMHGRTPTGAKVEVFLLECLDSTLNCWSAIGKPLRKMRTDQKVLFSEKLEGELEFFENCDEAIFFNVTFNQNYQSLMRWLAEHGNTPLPPYIKRATFSEEEDRANYQTIFAQHHGSVAAPTASLHFTEDVFENLKKRSIEIQCVTLHVGAGTFLPVKNSNIAEHTMHFENYCVPPETWKAVEKAKSDKRPIIAAGTTSFRSLTDYYEKMKSSDTPCGDFLTTNLFIFPKFHTDVFHSELFSGIITNFHQPESTLIMLISALIGFEERKRIYDHAIANQYRLFSFGDASLLFF